MYEKLYNTVSDGMSLFTWSSDAGAGSLLKSDLPYQNCKWVPCACQAFKHNVLSCRGWGYAADLGILIMFITTSLIMRAQLSMNKASYQHALGWQIWKSGWGEELESDVNPMTFGHYSSSSKVHRTSPLSKRYNCFFVFVSSNVRCCFIKMTLGLASADYHELGLQCWEGSKTRHANKRMILAKCSLCEPMPCMSRFVILLLAPCSGPNGLEMQKCSYCQYLSKATCFGPTAFSKFCHAVLSKLKTIAITGQNNTLCVNCHVWHSLHLWCDPPFLALDPV